MGKCVVHPVHAGTEGSVPVGCILLWSGSVASIPEGWALCDGSNGTPNLKDRFVVGAGGWYAVGDTGGSSTVALTTAQMPSHSHSASINTANAYTAIGELTPAYYPEFGVLTTGGDLRIADGTTFTPMNGGYPTGKANLRGSISASIGNNGSGQAHENRPPYYALCYIMRIL